jgi:transcription initiation factor TFIID TATA-box-binding protein
MREGSGQQFEQHSFVHKGRTIDYAIVNLVASGGLNANLDLYNLAMSIPNIEYEPEQFPGAILKMKEPKVSMLLFKNGKIICSGASAQSQIDVAIKKANKMINEIQPSVKILKTIEYEVVNLVATGNLHQNLDLFATAMQLENVEYEPEQFPGAILRMDNPKLTMLLFKNGKVICAGAKNEKEMIRGLETADDLVRGMKSGATPRKKKTMESDDGEEDEDEDFDEEEMDAPIAPAKSPAKVPVKHVSAVHAAPLAEEETEEKEDDEKDDLIDDEDAEDEDEIDLSPIKGKNRKAPVKPVKKKKMGDDDDDDDLDDEKETKEDEEDL